jgi:hypothetical protein
MHVENGRLGISPGQFEEENTRMTTKFYHPWQIAGFSQIFSCVFKKRLWVWLKRKIDPKKKSGVQI